MFLHLVLMAAGLVSGAAPASDEKTPAAVIESARGLPVAYDVDVVVVGGSTGAVAAAVAAAENGAKVFLAAPRHYLGEDLCGTLRLWREPGEEVSAPLAARLYPADKPATPSQIKKALDTALLSVKTLADTKHEGNRTGALREIMLARALFLLGDHDGVARAVLEDYAQDLRGHFARHATAVLASVQQSQ